MKKNTKKVRLSSTTMEDKTLKTLCPKIGGCGNGWTCDRCPNLGCPANERN